VGRAAVNPARAADRTALRKRARVRPGGRGHGPPGEPLRVRAAGVAPRRADGLPDSMPLRHLSHLTWEEIRALDRGHAVAILPVGATEAHGPHLPLDTDVTIAEAMAEAGGRRLAALGVEAWLLPPLAYTPAGFAAAFPGTIDIEPDVLASLIVGIATSLHRAGVSTFAIANAHLDPAHLEALHAAAGAVRDRGLVTVAFPDLTKRPWGSRLGVEFRTGACHAGRYEGSIVLARTPERVRREILAELPANPASLSEAIRDGATSFRQAGGERAYFGWPADATAEEGKATIETLGGILAEAVADVVEWDELDAIRSPQGGKDA